MLDCKSLRAAFMICATLVNTQTHILHIERQTDLLHDTSSLVSCSKNCSSQTVRAPSHKIGSIL